MLLSIFSAIYEALIGPNSDYSEYRESIFSSVGILSFAFMIVICFLFYVALGRWKGIWYTRTHWFITVFLCAAIGFGLAYFMARDVLGVMDVDGYLLRFASFNALYCALYFIIFSFLFKRFSIFAKRTPF